MDDVLQARDKRVAYIESMLDDYDVILSLRCNYPGEKKDNPYTNKVVTIIHQEIEKSFNPDIAYYFCDKEGPIYLYGLKHTNGLMVKKHTINMEVHHPLGRLVDLDVYDGSIKSISREKKRKCFLCSNDAFTCIVTKKHAKEALIEYFHSVVNAYVEIPLKMIEYTNQAMLYELFMVPSFGRITAISNGSHQDMNAYHFIDSISVLNHYMYRFAKLGYQEKSVDTMYDEAIAIGLACEKAMFEKTKGVNTHKGLIFVLGTLVVCSAKVLYEKENFEKIFLYCQLLVQKKLQELKEDNLQHKNLSHGEEIYHQHKISGVREEAALGFPTIQHVLKIVDIDKKETFTDAFIHIMAHCEDTTIIYRKGLKGLEYVQKIMNNLITDGYDSALLNEISNQFIKERISPGGSADLLCGTLFLSLIKNKIKGK